MNALQQRNEDVKYAKSLGIVKPHTMKGDALKAAILEAEKANNTFDPNPPVITATVTTDDSDPFDDIDPALEGDHLTEDETPDDVLKSRDATREAWLLGAVDELRPLLRQAGATVPSSISISVGFPSKNVRKRIGECWPTRNANGGTSHMFVSPLLEEPIEVLGTVLHELIHASDDCESGHSGHFRMVATAVGLTGKMTATTVGDELKPMLEDIAKTLGEYPHIKLNLAGRKKQTTRLLKGVCSDTECPLMDAKGTRYTIRLTQKWVEVGMPSCPCGAEMNLGGGE